MKTKILASLTCSVLLINTTIAQITCNNFAVLSVEQSSNPDAHQVAIFFDHAENEFANYPFVHSILNCNNDTIATGNMEIFGMFGQTSHTFFLNPTDISSDCLPYTVVLVYSNNMGETDTCFVNYSTLNIENQPKTVEVTVFPNPTEGNLNISVDNRLLGMPYQIIDALGRTVLSGKIEAPQTQLNVDALSQGVYNLIIETEIVKFVKN